MPRFVEERLVVGEAALRARDEVHDLRGVGGDHAGARALLRPVFEVQADVGDRVDLEPELANRLDAHLDRPVLRVGRLEGRQATEPAEVRTRGQLLALRPEQPQEPALAQPRVLLVDRVGRAAEYLLELSQGDLLLALVARHRVRFARELRFEIFAGFEELTPLLVEARIELQRQITELFALRVVRQDCELRVSRAQGQLLTIEREPRGEQRILECVLVLDAHSIHKPPLAGLAQTVEALTFVALGQLFCPAQRLELRPCEEVGVAGHDGRQFRHLLLANPDSANFLTLVPVVIAEA